MTKEDGSSNGMIVVEIVHKIWMQEWIVVDVVGGISSRRCTKDWK